MEMKRTLVSLLNLTALFSLLTLTSCQKEQMGNGTQFRATMEGCTSEDGKTSLNGNSLNWVEGDQIAVYGNAGSGLYTATPQTPATVAVFDNVSGETGEGPFRAYYPSTLTTDGVNITLPATQTYVEGSINEFPMYAESTNNQLAFKNLCGVLKLHLTKANTNISTIAVTANTEINGTFRIDFSNGIPEMDYVSDGTNTTVLACATAQAIDNGADFYIYLPAGNYTGLQIEMNTDDGKYCIKTANTTINVARSQYTLVTLGENDLNFVVPLPEGALPGLFTINENGDQVRFSKGNLQYQASTDTWRFAEHQWDTIGFTNDNISSTYTGWIDLFAWGTGNNPIQGSIVTYSDFSTFVDWGENVISNGGNQNNIWHTLSSEEWDYILNTRSGSQIGEANELHHMNARFVTATVNNVNGLILFPDNYNHPTGVAIPQHINDSWYFSGLGNWSNCSSYSSSEWSEMEVAGAVFLPAAGVRLLDLPPFHDGIHIGTNHVNQSGSYWTSSTNYRYGERVVGYLYFKRTYCISDYVGWSGQCERYSVRLVQ